MDLESNQYRNYSPKIVKKVEGGYKVELYKRKIPSNRFIEQMNNSSPIPM